MYVDCVPPMLATRLTSLRVFDAEGMMLDAEVVEGGFLDEAIRRRLADPTVAELHIHHAAGGALSPGSFGTTPGARAPGSTELSDLTNAANPVTRVSDLGPPSMACCT